MASDTNGKSWQTIVFALVLGVAGGGGAGTYIGVRPIDSLERRIDSVEVSVAQATTTQENTKKTLDEIKSDSKDIKNEVKTNREAFREVQRDVDKILTILQEERRRAGNGD